MSAGDAAVAELVAGLGVTPEVAAGIVARLVAASADEAGARVRVGIVAPHFHQAGGGIQIFILDLPRSCRKSHRDNLMSNSTDQFLVDAEQVLRKILMYAGSGEMAIPQEQLEYVKGEIHKMKDVVAAGHLPPKNVRYPMLTQMIVDQWPLGHSLGKAISELEDEYRKL